MVDKQKSLFGKSGLPGQGNLFPDLGVPDSMVLKPTPVVETIEIAGATFVVEDRSEPLIERLATAAVEVRKMAAAAREKDTLDGAIDAARHEAFAAALDKSRAALIAGAQ